MIGLSPLVAALIAWAAMALLMAALWRRAVTVGNAGIVDVAWSFGTGLCGAWMALAVEGDVWRRTLVGVLAAAWGIRLGRHLWRRVARESEDGRYADLRERWGDRTNRNLLVFFQVQATWAVLFALPMLAAALVEAPFIGPADVVGLAIIVLAVTGESIADHQLARWKATRDDGEIVCRRGLWAWSRHPNYFFEWVHWIGWTAIAAADGLTWRLGMAVLAGPVLMLVFLLKVTGIPPAEARMARTKGEAYRRYQREVSAFVPLPPRKPTGAPT